MSETSYAVLTRAKAKYGKRLTDKDYKSLMDCENVAEVMTYLKTNTHYIKAFGEANERGIRRGLFENLLKQYISYEFDTICRYELSVGEDFSQYIAHKTEVNEIVRFLTLLNSAGNEEFHFTIPAHMAKKTSIDPDAISKANTFEQLLNALKSTPYEKVLEKYKPQDGEPLPITEIEDSLYYLLYTELYQAIDKADGTESVELRDLFDTIFDYENFVRIIRLKKYYNSDPETIKKHLLPFGSLTEKKLNELCEAKNSAAVFSVMCNTKTGKIISDIDYFHAGGIPLRIKFKKARQNMYFSDSPATVMMSYIILSEIELHNLICIIEGVRYNVDRERIELLLIY